MATFAEMEYFDIYRIYIVPFVDQHESVDKLYRLHIKTSSMVSINDTFEKEDYLQ